MRKTFVTAFVALLAILAFASCDNIPTDQNGDGLVTLKITSDKAIDLPAGVTTGVPTNNGRSLTSALAHSKAAYVEVIFKHTDGTYFQKADYFTNPLEGFEISVKGGTYSTASAIMLIGTMDGTLLATGVPTAQIIVPNVTTITFNVTSLTSNISAHTIPEIPASGPTPAVPAVPPDFSIDDPIKTTFTSKTTADEKFQIPGENTKRPCFQVPNNQAGIKASLTINGLSAISSNIIVTDEPTVTFLPAAPAITKTVTTPAAAAISAGTAAIGTTKQLAFEFTTTDVGQYRITFNIPVRGFAKTGVPNAIDWKIKGGTATGWDVTGAGAQEGVALIVITDPDSYTVSVGTSTWADGQ